LRAVRPKLNTRKGAKMPDHFNNKSLFTECLQAEATYGTLLPCEHFGPGAGYEPDTGAACLPEGRSNADFGSQQFIGGKW
jgi:hypothetical protein